MSSKEQLPELPDKLYFRIGEVAQIIGVDAHVLRYWEAEMEMSPHRSNSGQRLYRKIDISEFLRIKRLVHEEGYTIAGAKKLLQTTNSSQAGIPVQQVQNILTELSSFKSQLQQLKQELRQSER